MRRHTNSKLSHWCDVCSMPRFCLLFAGKFHFSLKRRRAGIIFIILLSHVWFFRALIYHVCMPEKINFLNVFFSFFFFILKFSQTIVFSKDYLPYAFYLMLAIYRTTYTYVGCFFRG